MPTIDATSFPLNETTTTTTIVSTLQNQVIDYPFSEEKNRIIVEASIEIADKFANIIEAYVSVKNTTNDDEYADTIMGAMDLFIESLKKLIMRYSSDWELSFGIFILWVSLSNKLERSAKAVGENPFKLAVNYFQIDLFKLSSLITKPNLKR